MIVINGQDAPFQPSMSVRALLESRGLDPARVAVERNGAIVRRADFDATALADGDKIEIVHFVGGG
ncbi:MAG: sulfur carrier protein ThiS [Butyricicoccus sp.]|nr:sulfur carrier protein ThiS [Butyricicoccus sp.]